MHESDENRPTDETGHESAAIDPGSVKTETGERPVVPMTDMALRIAEALKRAGVNVHVAFDGVHSGAFVISEVPRGRRPTIERVMATFPHRWRYGVVRR